MGEGQPPRCQPYIRTDAPEGNGSLSEITMIGDGKRMSSEDRSRPQSRSRAIPALLLGLLVVFMMVAITACGGGSSSGGGGGGGAEEDAAGPGQEGGTLELSQGEEILGMNPLTQFLPEDNNVMVQMFETLWKEDKQGKIVPWLIQSAKASNSDKTWTLQLKEGIKFSSGQVMTSADVKWTLERDFESEVYASLMEVFEKVEAPSPSSIVITLKEPRPELPIMMTQWTFSVLPKNFGGVSEKEFALHPVGTGPFKFASWKKGEAVTLEKNPDYWRKGLPHLQKVVFRTVQNPNSRVSELRGGQLDAIQAPPFQELESLESSETEVGEYGEGFGWILVLNNEKPVFQNAKVREAINIGVDRKAMLETALFGRGTEAASYLPPPNIAWDSSLVPPELNVEKAKLLLAEAVKEGVDPTFTLMVPSEIPFWINASQIVQANLEEIGFKVTISKRDSGTVFAQAEENNYDALAVWNTSQVLSPVELFSFYVGVRANWSNASTDRIAKLFAEAQAEINDQKRLAIWHQMQQIIYEEQFITTLTFSNYTWAFRNSVSDFYVAPTGIIYLEETSLAE